MGRYWRHAWAFLVYVGRVLGLLPLRPIAGAARYSYKDATFEFDNSGGTPVDMSNYITEGPSPAEVEAILEETTALGDTWEEHHDTGIRRAPEITLSGPYDDTATTGPDAIFNAVGATRTAKWTFGGSKTFEVETIIRRYRVNLKRGGLHMFEVTLQPTGTVTQA